jgi:hypothetical protein
MGRLEQPSAASRQASSSAAAPVAKRRPPEGRKVVGGAHGSLRLPFRQFKTPVRGGAANRDMVSPLAQ